MKFSVFIALVSCLAWIDALSVENVDDGNCAFGSYPPSSERKLPTFVVNLDENPTHRWTALVKAKKQQINDLINNIRNLSDAFFHGKLIHFIDIHLPKLAKTLPYPYYDELAGIANATDIPLGEITLYNIFYEVFSLCTSIIAEDTQGNIFHARNLDFGLFMGWDIKNKTWISTEILRTMLVNVDFQKNGKTLFRSVQYAGYVGILTAMKPKLFSLTIDERFKLKGGYIGILQWILGYRKGSWVGFLAREVMENATSYSEAQKILSTKRLLSPVYFILGGNKSREGCVITRGLTEANVWELGATNNSWYLVETNYDHWEKPPFYDDRRTPTIRCLEKLSQKNVTVAGLFDVLSSKPALNKLTTYAAIMRVNKDVFESYLQSCKDPCSPW